VGDRALRLGVPLVVYQFAFAPIVEYVDVQNKAGWEGGFPRFVWYSWQHFAPGPLWFLWVLLVFSIGYVALRAVVPARPHVPASPPARVLVAVGVFVAVASYRIRIRVQFGQEVINDFFLAQSPGWVAGFALGIVGAERGWFDRVLPAMSRVLFRVAWAAAGAVAVLAPVTIGGLGWEGEDLLTGGTWGSAVIAVLQGALVVAMSMWLVDVFRRRFNRQGRLLREMGRAAFAAYVLHQVVLVATVLATRHVGWPPELEWLAAASLAVVIAFGIGALLTRVPGVSHIL
jgi:fucose 4-O-acetylase-like acetyltransferase